MRIIFIVIFYCTINAFSILKAQNLKPILINISEELPTQEVYDIFQDTVGYIWLATEIGIIRYDGTNFEEIDINESQITSVYSFFKESNNKVWVNTHKNELYHFNPYDFINTIAPYKNNSKLVKASRQITTKNSIYINQLFFEEEELRITFIGEVGVISFDKNDQLKADNFRDSYFSYDHFDLYITVNQKYIGTYFGKRKTTDSKIYLIWGSRTFLVKDIFERYHSQSYSVSSFIKTKTGYYILLDRYLIKLTNNSITTKVMPSKGLCLKEIDDEISVGTFDGLYTLDSKLNFKKQILPGEIITSVLYDNEFNLWISTIGNGIFYTKNTKAKILKNTNTFDARKIAFVNNYFVIKNSQSELYIYNTDGSLEKKSEQADESKGIYNCSEDLSKFLGNHVIIKRDKTYYKYGGSDKSIVFSGRDKYYNIIFDSVLIRGMIKDSPYINDFEYLKDSSFLISTVNGLYKVELPFGLDTSKFKNFSLNKDQIIKNTEYVTFGEIFDFKYGQLINSDKGLAIYKQGNKEIEYVQPREKRSRTQINDIYVDHDTVVWLSTNYGITKITFSKKEFFIDYQLSISNELPTNHILSISSDNNNYWICTRKGIFIVDKNVMTSKHSKIKAKHFIVDSIKIDDQKIRIRDTLSIEYNNNLTLFFKLISFNKNTIEYQIDSSEWFRTNSNNIRTGALSSGSHILKFRVNQIDRSTIIKKYYINVSKPFTQKLWFIMVVIILISFFIFFLTKLYFNYKNKKQYREHEKLRLELKVLTSQMNPHFMFNTINSIQHSILKKDKFEAMEYLSNFALLIRKTLDFSINERITIEEEINFLKLYVNLENSRFSHDFKLDFQINNDINVERDLIPSLLIQPLLENVFIHSKYDENQEKIITLKIEHSDLFYFIRLIDYGSQKTSIQSKSTHKSHGLSILRNRIKLYNGGAYIASHLKSYPTNPNGTGRTVAIKLKKWKQ